MQDSGAKKMGNRRAQKRLLDRTAQMQDGGAKNIGNSLVDKRLLQ